VCLTPVATTVYDRLYDDEEDKFDLSRVPDVHDNVRFDCLHNPHLGLSVTLNKLYNLSKDMADCVVVRSCLRLLVARILIIFYLCQPLEYGTTVAEKRSVGVKICHSLLEKLNTDLLVARTDNHNQGKIK
jgi:inositol-hexakisphosphate/diphosphoinositol-pentakisphosphate 1-kinase